MLSMTKRKENPRSEHTIPTAEQKLAIYTKAKEYVLENGRYRCICIAMREAQQDLRFIDEGGYRLWKTSTHYHSSGYNDMEHNFPELFKRKPKRVTFLGVSWWEQFDERVNKKRLAAINGIIAELKREIKAKSNDKA